MLPQSNATLTAVTAQAHTADWDLDESGSPKWTGTIDAYFHTTRRRVTTAAGLDVLVERSLIIEEGEVAALIAQDDVVTFSFGGGSQTGKVQVVERRVLPCHPLQTTRITLLDA